MTEIKTEKSAKQKLNEDIKGAREFLSEAGKIPGVNRIPLLKQAANRLQEADVATSDSPKESILKEIVEGAISWFLRGPLFAASVLFDGSGIISQEEEMKLLDSYFEKQKQERKNQGMFAAKDAAVNAGVSVSGSDTSVTDSDFNTLKDQNTQDQKTLETQNNGAGNDSLKTSYAKTYEQGHIRQVA